MCIRVHVRMCGCTCTCGVACVRTDFTIDNTSHTKIFTHVYLHLFV